MKSLLSVTTLSLALLVGCKSPMTILKQADNASLSILPLVTAGSYRTQAEVSPYTDANVTHLTLRMFRLNDTEEEIPVVDGNGNPVSKDIPHADLGKAVNFSHLALYTTYRIRAYAYADAGTSTLISMTDSASYVDVEVTDDDRPALTTFTVKLKDTTFDGQASGPGIAISDGAVVTEGDVEATFTDPD